MYHQKEIIRNKKYITITTKKQTLMKLTKLFFAALIVFSANAAIAQDTKVATHLLNINIPEVALLDLEVAASGSTTISLNGTAPTEAGLPMTFGTAATNSSINMNYSSIVKGASLRNISVKLSSLVPTGLKLTVLASGPATGGAGTLGTASGELTLTNVGQSIVTGIGSTYTGDGVSKGRNLTYKLDYATGESTDYAALRFDLVDAAPITITYTLSDI
ncbi:MAG: hypothetical protein APF83_10355 [Lutibacter sp. BRH_c52]|nr:MAG: hypothetical protein APF83_10355 [Lutibacter sp. BRH_c52]